ncbi:hypothetical protein J6590_040853 [Homalodisca vitripennis]|nr:hypothetical protein J6590_040853 [Homalodisca vitripennis]
MAKYSCGICNKNVRFSAILCTGRCNKWLHFKCAKLSALEVKNMVKDDYLGEWKCVKCQVIPINHEIRAADVNEDSEGNSDVMNFSSLAEEINESILHTNEELRQELYETKNRNSLYTLELEDKIKEMEENRESQMKYFDVKEEELLKKIESLEKKLKNEKEGTENLILYLEKDTVKNNMQIPVQSDTCESCDIYKDQI